MFEFLRELLSTHNLPCTALLGMVLFYWLLVTVGVLDSDIDAGGDLPDSGGGHDSPAPLNVQSHPNATAAAGGGSLSTTKQRRIFSFGEVPLNIVGSVMAIFLWMFSMLANFYFNGTPGNRSGTTAALLLIPNFFVSLILTRIAIIPLDYFFTALQHTATENEVIIGREARVVSTQVDERYGQVEVTTAGAPLLVNVKIPAGAAPVTKGSIVTITSSVADGSHYLIAPVSPAEPSPSTP